MPTHQRQRIARCDQHLSPPRAGFIAQRTRLNCSVRPIVNRPAQAGVSAMRPI
jgi:hypothetical protein